MSRRIVLASSNAGKLREFRALLEPGDFEVVSQGELGIESAEEPHLTFIENALAKARHVSRASGLPALADDSGICVDALGGAPGVQSARYAGDNPKSGPDLQTPRDLLRSLLLEETVWPRWPRLKMQTRSGLGGTNSPAGTDAEGKACLENKFLKEPCSESWDPSREAAVRYRPPRPGPNQEETFLQKATDPDTPLALDYENIPI